MLRIDRVELENFGPFKGKQAITLPGDPGVVVVYGENMRGKTSLLNAIRFALFGKVLGRASRESSLHQIGNWEQADAGQYGFKVVLRFQSDGKEYRLTRSCEPRDGVVPKQDDDYTIQFYLKRDRHVLSPGEAKSELERILPEQIARFFLFDGELLQEYEGLLRSESDMGRQISEAIERILGVPILTESRATLRKVLADYEEKEAKSALANNRTSELGTQMNGLREERQVLEDGRDEMKGELEQLRTKKAELESELSRNERYANTMQKRDSLREEVEALDGQIETRRGEIAAAMGDAWKLLVATRAADLIDDLRDRAHVLQVWKVRQDALQISTDRGGDPGDCPTCLQPLSDKVLEQMTATAANEAVAMEEVEQELGDIQRRLGALRGVARESSDSGLRMIWGDLHRLERSRLSKQDEATELDRRLREAQADQGAVRRAQSDLEQTIKLIGLKEAGIQEQEAKLSKCELNLSKVRIRLESMGEADVEGTRQRLRLCNDLFDIFDHAVAKYRDLLRKQVEHDASALFLRLTTEEDYQGLRINESYGLTILHKDGSEIPVRSAGAEHVVALSLVGALQKNAPLQGPIFIDSPFGRLDTEHTKKVVAALPTMTDQVCLLVYQEELRPELARELLEGRLRAEYSLSRVSARHSQLKER